MRLEGGKGEEHAVYNIAKEREYDKEQKRLYEEFKKLDRNGDGYISLEEIIMFLRERVSCSVTMGREEKI